MAAAIRDLLDNPPKRETIERQARMTVERRFDWDVIAGQQKRMYEELIGEAFTGM
jgi:glycosyltransferase involved in cell wall biosynthesis